MNKDYLFVIPPSNAVLLQVEHYKGEVAKIIGQYPGMHTKAHLTVNYLPNKNPHQVTLALETIKRNAVKLPPVNIGINGFSFFEHIKNNTLTIYIAVKGTYQTDNWLDALKKCFPTTYLKIPHITITKGMSANNFYKLWPQFKQLTYQDTFVADKVLVFERNAIPDNKGYRKIDVIHFNNELDTSNSTSYYPVQKIL